MSRATACRLGRLVAALVAVNLVGAALAIARLAPASSSAPVAAPDLRLDLPDVHPAGDDLMVDVAGLTTDVVELDIVVSSAAGTVRRTLPVDGPTVRAAVSGDALVAAGPAVIWVIAGATDVAATVEILPGDAVDPLVPLAGPKSIVADGLDHAMIVALPADALGNAVPSRAEVAFTAVRPDGRIEAPSTVRTGLVAWTRLTSGLRAGRSVVSATLGAASGPAAEVDEVADRPVAFALRWTDAPDTPLVADGRRLHRLATDRIVDRNGNVVPDGTAVALRATEPTGVRQATAVTIDGRAEFHLEAPDRPGTVEAVASVAGVTSTAVVLDFGAAPVEVPVRVIGGGDVDVTLAVGPVISTLGGWVPDGTEITFRSRQADVPVVGVLRDGVATIPLGSVRPGGTLTVLGVDVEVAP